MQFKLCTNLYYFMRNRIFKKNNSYLISLKYKYSDPP